MSELDPVAAEDPPFEPRPTFVEIVAQEQASEAAPCDTTQVGVPGNVCVRDPGHDGPHVGMQTADDGTSYFVQWED